MRLDRKNQTLNDYQELVVDPQLLVVSANGGLFQHKAINGPITPGIHLSQVFKGFWSPDIRSLCLQALHQGQTGTVVRELDRDGAYLVLEVNASPRIQDQRVIGVFVQVRDVTIEKRLQRQQAVNDKMKTISLLASEIVHKMNNPIAAILNRIGGLLVEDENENSVKTFRSELYEIQEQLYAISLVTNALTAFSMEKQTDFKLIQVNAVIENAVNLLKLFEIEKKVVYNINLDDQLPRILGSEVTLEQGLVNILRNAFESAPEKGGEVAITSKIDEQFKDFITISIADNGSGIAPEYLEFVIDPFFSTKKDGNHNGLGLSVAYGIVSNHHGSIEISSTPQKGTTVNILLPIASSVIGR